MASYICPTVGLPNASCCEPRLSAASNFTELAIARDECWSDACPYLVRSPFFSCAFYCVPQQVCGVVDPRNAFADAASFQCSECRRHGCKVCATRDTCAECLPFFHLKRDGNCVYDRDEWWYYYVLVPLILLTVIALILFCIWLTLHYRDKTTRSDDVPESELDSGPEPRVPVKRRIFRLARRHYHWCKIRNWFLRYDDPDGDGDVSQPGLVSLFANVHRKNLTGLGMILYYNSLVYMSAFFLLLFAGQALYCRFGFDDHRFDSLRSIEAVIQGYAGQKHGVDVDQCSKLNDQFVSESLEAMQKSSVLEFALLYAIGLTYAIAFACYQKRRARRFVYENDSSMSPYALLLKGIDTDSTDELELKAWFEERLSELAKRPVELAYVSICYNTWQGRDQLEQLIDQLIVMKDVEMQTYPVDIAVDAPSLQRLAASAQSQSPASWVKTSREEWTEAVLSYLDTHIYKNAGQAFAVFKTSADCAECYAAAASADSEHFVFDTPGQRLLGYQSDESHLSSCSSASGSAETCADDNGGVSARSLEQVPLRRNLEGVLVCPAGVEPVAFNWYHFGLSRMQRGRNGICAVIKIVFFIALLDCLIMVPFIYYRTNYNSVARTDGGGVGAMFYGVFLATANWLVCVSIAGQITASGLLHADVEEVLIFFCFTAVMVFNTSVNIAVFLHMTHNDMKYLASGQDLKVVAAIATQMRVADTLYDIAKGFFISPVLWPLQGFFWPYIQSLLTMWAWDADYATVRRAERKLEPLPYGPAWDYQYNITVPFVGLLITFLVSNHGQRMLLMLVFWALFFYCVQKFTHLRHVKMSFTTTNRLDTAVQYVWGLILGELAVCAAYWGYLAYGWPVICCPAAGLIGCLVFWVVLTFIIRPLEWETTDHDGRKKPWTVLAQEEVEGWGTLPIEEAEKRTIYSWANCNPVLVLKSHVFDLSAAGIQPLAPFTVGKSHAWAAMEDGDGMREADTVPYEPANIFRCLRCTP